MEHKQTEATIIATDEAEGIVEAIWAVMGNVDQGGDIIHPGAFTKTFNERGSKIRVLDQHRTDSVMSAVGIVKELKELHPAELPQEILERYPEATGGAWGKFQFLLDTPEGKGVFTRIQKGAIQEWSFGYDAIEKDESTIYQGGQKTPVRNLRAIKLYEVSPVLWGMNSATTTTSAKAVEETPEEKAGRVLSGRNATRIKEAMQALHDCLKEAGLMEAAEEVEEASKEKSATGPQLSDDTPTSESASEAGPPKEECTRLKTIIELELEALKLLEV